MKGWRRIFEKLGLRPGDTVYTHTSLKRVGWIDGGPWSLIGTLLDVLGGQGTLCAPTHALGYDSPLHRVYGWAARCC